MKWTVTTILVMILAGIVGFFGFALLVVALSKVVGPIGLLLAYPVIFAFVILLVVWQSRSKWVEKVPRSAAGISGQELFSAHQRRANFPLP